MLIGGGVDLIKWQQSPARLVRDAFRDKGVIVLVRDKAADESFAGWSHPFQIAAKSRLIQAGGVLPIMPRVRH